MLAQLRWDGIEKTLRLGLLLGGVLGDVVAITLDNLALLQKRCRKIGIVDKIFTRVGAQDDLSSGQSTFMVEMMEVSNILRNATPNSLVILDEIGRGTSTYDGLSIAWAVAEFMADKNKLGCKTLFATHYHELIDMANRIDGIRNFSVAVKEKGEDVIFLRKIVEGGTDESYGIHVARLAGVPKQVLNRADKILKSLEKDGKKVVVNEKEDKKQVERTS